MIKCLECGSEFTDKQTDNVSRCPNCGTDKLPIDTTKDFMLKINPHVLRCLTIWASNYAKEKNFNCDPIIREIRNALPKEQQDIYLTMKEEIQGLANHTKSKVDYMDKTGTETFYPKQEKSNDEI